MGMFDYYEPVPVLVCRCGKPLDGWQGKDALCELFTWTQGKLEPTLSRFELLYGSKERSSNRLPDGELNIYTQCEGCNEWVDAECIVKQGLWAETRIVRQVPA